MGRRQRRRQTDPWAIPPRKDPATRIARVRANDKVWAVFKSAIGNRTVADVLGGYVEAEIAKAKAKRLRKGDITGEELLDALDDAAATTEKLRILTGRLERLRAQRG
jgi:hypothetical protein